MGGATQYVIDIQGYFTSGSGSSYVPVSPCRVVDTRKGGGALVNGAQRAFQVTGSGSGFVGQGASAAGCGVPVGAVAVEASITAVSPAVSGYARAWPNGGSVPTATFLNFSAGQSITNTGTVSLAVSGSQQLRVLNVGGATQYVIDIQGYFTVPGDPPGAPTAVTAVARDGGAVVSWTPPEDTGTHPISGYVVTPFVGGVAQAATSFSSTATSQLVAGLTNGTGYTFTVAATSLPGTGEASTPSAVVTPVAPGASVSAGAEFSCARTGGTVSCWGYGAKGQLGNGTKPDSPTTTPVPVTGITTAKAVSAGSWHACALLANGTIKCWGTNASGELGNGTKIDSATPVTVSGITTATSVSAGAFATCARLADRTVRCWGANHEGELGTGIPKGGTATSPTAVPGVSTAIDVSLGTDHACALLSGGAVRCWGTNLDLQLGNGSRTDSAVPVAVSGITTATAISAGSRHTCARLIGGGVRCWGYNLEGQLGDGTTSETLVPVAVQGVSSATSVGVGGIQACASLVDGTSRCWGSSLHGNLGTGSLDQTSPLGSVPVVTLTNAISIDSGGWHSCAVRVDNSIKCWGENSAGQSGYPVAGWALRPVTPTDITTATAIATGKTHTCAVLVGGTVKCWGLNSSGEIGDGQEIPAILPSVPPTTVVGITDAVDVGAGDSSTCALLASGTVKCWGGNALGQLGNGTTVPSTTPVTVTGISTATAISVGAEHACAIISGGTVKCWGRSFGATPQANSSTPVTITGISTAVELSSGFGSPCAVLADGSITCWSSAAVAPASVAGITSAVGVTSGEGYVCAVLANGTVRCRGNNITGQLGDGTTTDRSSPVEVVGISTATAVSGARNHVCARLADATLRCWGNDVLGRLGDGRNDPTPVAAPVTVLDISTASAVSSAQGFSCALLADGEIRCWGANEYGAYGGPDYTAVPVSPPGL